jgi:dCTP deaminase
MILCDSELKAALFHRQLIIEPMPTEDRISTSSIDLTLGNEFKQWNTPSSTVDPTKSYRELAAQSQVDVPVNSDGSVSVTPNSFLLALTAETVSLPNQSRLAARVEGRSSLARLGLGIHVTAPTIHAGFTGRITLEITNVGPLTILLMPGLKVCQLIIEQVFGTPVREFQSVFQGQRTVSGSS